MFTGFFATTPVSKAIHKIDSITSAIKKLNVVVLSECDSIADINGDKDYKCFNYYFKNDNINSVVKISISFNNCEEKLLFYYNESKVIKLEHYSIVNCRQLFEWSVYMDNDKEIYTIGSRGLVRVNEVESGNYFFALAKDFAKKNKY